MTESVAIELPHGISVNGTHTREALLRRPSGEDHLFLAEECGWMLPAQWTTEALARCLTRLGPYEPPGREAVRSLTVGDREALLLHLHRLVFGEPIRCTVSCPSAACGAKLDIDLQAAALLMPPYAHGATEHELTFTAGGQDIAICFRLPTGADHEASAVLARTDLAGATDLMLRQCVRSIACEGEPETADAFEARISERMAELDPQADLMLRADCPECGCAFCARFDAASFVRQELDGSARNLYREIHILAFHYHWSAAEILHMSARARRRYLQLLEDELSQRSVQ